MDSTIKAAEERLQRLSGDEQTLQLYEAREEALIEYTSSISAARRAGMKEGVEIGEKKGEEKGERNGRIKAKQEIAKNMLSLGLDIESIEKCTGMSVEEIQKLNK
ncbi:hypothetical protein K7P76_03430 [Cohnella sp. NL03-T5]|nr:hypothetical protein [Cohnella silvisoli]